MKSLHESLMDNESDRRRRAINNTKRDLVVNWCEYAITGKLDEDYSIDESENGFIISVYGRVPSIVIDENAEKTIKDVRFFIPSIAPTMRCKLTIKSPDAASTILPMAGSLGDSRFTSISLIYDTKEDLKPIHFPRWVHGDISIRNCKSLNLSIMPNCENLTIYTKHISSKIKYPAGFPEHIKQIDIN